MTVKSHDRGWPTFFDGSRWRYQDTGELVNHLRRCKRCGQPPTSEGHDACLGHLDGVAFACCGHGVEPGYTIKQSSKKGIS